MGIEIHGGRDAMRVHMYGTMNQNTFNYIQNRMDSLESIYGSQASWFTNRLQQRFNESAVRANIIAQSNLEYSGGLFDDGVRTFRTVEDFRKASRINQTYILSNPYFANEYNSARIEGWGYKPTKYQDLVGEDNPYYQNVVDGMLQYDDESLFGEVEEKFVIYSNEELDELQPLRLNESIMIRNNWNRLYNLINQESEDELEDPTSLHGSYL